jgi:hypothetical protein
VTENANPASTKSMYLPADVRHVSADSTDPDQGTEARERSGASPERAELPPFIERTRQGVAGTVDQLATRLDVKGRIRHRLAAARDVAAHQLESSRNRASNAPSTVDQGRLALGSGVLAAVVAVLAVGLWRRNQRPRRLGRRLR